MNIKLLFIPLLLFSSQLYAETIHLGILNTSGNEAENVLYAETASVLKNKLKPRNVEVSTYDLPGLEKAIATGKLDFFISNPGFYVSSRQKLDTTALASQSNQFFRRPDRALGSVFVVPQQNGNNFSLRDLKGKSVCAVAPGVLGVTGVETLHGASLKSPDLRGGAALVAAALGAEGESTVADAGHILRGYESLNEALRSLGASVWREEG